MSVPTEQEYDRMCLAVVMANEMHQRDQTRIAKLKAEVSDRDQLRDGLGRLAQQVTRTTKLLGRVAAWLASDHNEDLGQLEFDIRTYLEEQP